MNMKRGRHCRKRRNRRESLSFAAVRTANTETDGKLIRAINKLGDIRGAVWVSAWGAVALVKFAFGLLSQDDWQFLGIVALYTINGFGRGARNGQ